MDLRRLLSGYGRRYSGLLGIRLRTGREGEIFKWLIASLLLGKRISETLAIRTYRRFESEGALSFGRMRRLSNDELVAILDAGGYTRYDFSTATAIMGIMKTLGGKYGGSLKRLHERARDARDLEDLVMELQGFGPVTSGIFLRELRGIWEKADPPLGPLASSAAAGLGIKDAKAYWKKNAVEGYDFVEFETALMRIGREARRRKRSVKGLLG